MKKISTLMLVLVIMVSLAGCGNVSEGANNSPLLPNEDLQSDYNFLLAEKEALLAEYDALKNERDELLSKSEKHPVTISGSFTAMVQLLMPDYVMDDTTPAIAIVTGFQSPPFVLYLGKDLISQVEVGKCYKFEILDKEVMLTQEQFETVSMSPEVVIPLYNLKIASIVEVEGNGIDTEGLSFQYSEEPSTNSSMVSSSGSVNENEMSETIEISCEGTVFSYNGNDYEITERNKLVYSIWGYEKVGKSIIIEGSVGKNAAYYGIFNTETLEFEKDIMASKITYWDDDIDTMVYSIDNEIYDYDDNAINGVELMDSEYIYDIYFEDKGKQLAVEIADLNSDEAPRIVRIKM